MKTAARRWVVLVLALAAILSAGLIFRDFLMQNVIMPIALLLWAILRVFMSIDQEVYWVILIFAAFVLGLGLLPVRGSRAVGPSQSAEPTARRFNYWHAIIRQAAKSREAREALESNLRELAVNVIAMEEQKHPNAVREDILQRRLDLTEDIRAFLLRGANGRRQTSKKGLQGRLTGLVKRSNSQVGAERLSPEKLLEYLERYAEIRDDHEPFQQN